MVYSGHGKGCNNLTLMLQPRVLFIISNSLFRRVLVDAITRFGTIVVTAKEWAARHHFSIILNQFMWHKDNLCWNFQWRKSARKFYCQIVLFCRQFFDFTLFEDRIKKLVLKVFYFLKSLLKNLYLIFLYPTNSLL